MRALMHGWGLQDLQAPVQQAGKCLKVRMGTALLGWASPRAAGFFPLAIRRAPKVRCEIKAVFWW